jgi:hypothetical protein
MPLHLIDKAWVKARAEPTNKKCPAGATTRRRVKVEFTLAGKERGIILLTGGD